MKKLYTTILIALLSINVFAQAPGEWTWMGGSDTMNCQGVYGIKGVSSPTNLPPSAYEASEWSDGQGNFWCYGGWNAWKFMDDLWKYNVATNQWTWMTGSGGLANSYPIYNLQGVASPSNRPGERITSASWTDHQGNLWLFGGGGYHGVGTGCDYNDLWKYNTTSNMWTYMKGDTFDICGGGYMGGHYGIKGVEDVLNNPRHTEEIGVTWTDDNDNLWMLDWNGCLWKYRIPTNNWTWINGDTTGAEVLGIKGIPSLNNTPGTTAFAYTRWKDSNNNLWMLYSGNGYAHKNILKYEINTNMWTWVWGDSINTTITSSPHYGDTLCDYTFYGQNENVVPFARCETRACWIDNCNNLWMMGGNGGDHIGYGDLNDLVYFDISISKWIWVGNDTVINDTSIFGTMGVSSPLNKPASRGGALPFKDSDGNLWLFGGINSNSGIAWSNPSFYGDLWKFTMDMGCPPCHNPTVGITENQNTNTITIAPNPTTTTTTITFSEEQKNTTIRVYDILGQCILQSPPLRGGREGLLDMSPFAKGIYFLQITDANKNTFNKKIVIQ